MANDRRWIVPPLAIGEDLVAAAVVSRLDRMDIDRTSIRVPHRERCRQPLALHEETLRARHAANHGDRLDRYDQIRSSCVRDCSPSSASPPQPPSTQTDTPAVRRLESTPST